MRTLIASALLLLTATAMHAQNVHVTPRGARPRPAATSSNATMAATSKAPTLTPAFKLAAEAALDVIDTAGWDDDAPEVVFAPLYAKARNELNRAKREVRTRQDAIAAKKLLVLFTSTGLCRSWRKMGVDYKECEARRVSEYDGAAAAIGAKTWDDINDLAGP
jgi:hypothetical protein